MNEMIQNAAVYALPILSAITLHEAAHAYAARYFGDSTAYAQGRMSLNPLRHIDPIGTILIPAVLFFSGSPFLLGYAKPVPVQFGRLRKPRRDSALVALAGPMANIVMALMWLILAILLAAWGGAHKFFLMVCNAGVVFNLIIFAFNLFPLPPLDGGRIMTSLLPPRLALKFSQLELYGFFIVLGLAVVGWLKYWMAPLMDAAGAMLNLMVLPLTMFLG
jgi:Zn-dependent protease